MSLCRHHDNHALQQDAAPEGQLTRKATPPPPPTCSLRCDPQSLVPGQDPAGPQEDLEGTFWLLGDRNSHKTPTVRSCLADLSPV